MEAKIYALSNPINNEVFYIGCTNLSLEMRLKGHYLKVNEANRGDINWNNRLIYLKQLLPQKANITLLDVCSMDEMYEKEKHYINHYSKLFQLTNQTIGGIGGNTYALMSTAQKIKTGELISKKIKGVKKPLGFSENLSVKRTGYGNPAAGKTKYAPIVLESSNEIIVFKNSIEANSYFSNKHTWSTIVSTSKHNEVNENKWYFKKTYNVNFLNFIEGNTKDIVASLLEREGNCYVFDKHTQKITIK